MVETRRLNALAAETYPRLDLPDGDLVVALSGGADSAALAWLLARAGSRKVRAVHVDHGFPASPTMRRAAGVIAERIGMPLKVVEVEVPDIASPENAARIARYAALEEEVGAGEALLTAHTADDNLETVILNLVRGAGTRGLAGIPRHGRAHRPMLGISRDVTREIAALAGLPFVDDPMNLDPALARTHIRTRVVPLLRALNPDLVDTVARSSEILSADADLLDSLSASVAPRETPEGLAVAVGELLALPEAVATRALRSMLAALGAPQTADAVARAMAVARHEAASAQLGRGVVATRRGAMLHLGRPEATAGAVELRPGITRHAGYVYEVQARDEVCRWAPHGVWQAIFPMGVTLTADGDGVVHADGERAWVPGRTRYPVAWYQPGTVGYLSVSAEEEKWMEIKPLITAEEIQEKLAEMGRQITEDYKGKDLLLVGVLRGAFMVMADLARHIDLPCEFDFMAVSSYGASTQTSGVVRILKDLDEEIEGRDVLVVEDIIDSGLTLNYLVKSLRVRKPASLEIASLLLKEGIQRVPIDVKYVGFRIGPEFVVGYGLDYAGKYRNLPYVGVMGDPS
jgi:hypoxanthine phosphoribosyltransferase